MTELIGENLRAAADWRVSWVLPSGGGAGLAEEIVMSGGRVVPSPRIELGSHV